MAGEQTNRLLPIVGRLRSIRSVTPMSTVSIVGHAVSLIATAFAAAFIKDNIGVATLLFALGVGTVTMILVHCTSRLERVASGIDSVLLKIDYLRIHERRNGVEITEAYVYRRALEEASKARESVDAFTSYLMEADGPTADDKATRKAYFDKLLERAKHRANPILYRRIAQARSASELIRSYRSSQALTYLEHLAQMHECEEAGEPVHVKSIDRHRPTTYAIIDNEVLLWQVNQVIREKDEMLMHGLFIIYDPANVFIRHFRREFDHYWDGEAKPLKVRL